MEFGMFHEFQALPGETAAESFANSLAQVDAAERWGLDAMWLAELHFAPERSVLASPMILAATIAQRTERMKIGTAVQVLPLCHPLRLAEEVATVDQLSHGRLIFGVGRSGFANTYKTYGVDYAESRERFTETLAILKRAFTEEQLLALGQVLHLRERPAGAQVPAAAVARDPRRRGQPRHLCRGGRARPSDLRRRAHRQYLRAGAAGEDLSRGLEEGGPSRRGRGLPARAGLCRRQRREGPRGAAREHHAPAALHRRSAGRLRHARRARAPSRTAPSAPPRCRASTTRRCCANA